MTASNRFNLSSDDHFLALVGEDVLVGDLVGDLPYGFCGLVSSLELVGEVAARGIVKGWMVWKDMCVYVMVVTQL